MSWVRQWGTSTFDRNHSVAVGSNDHVYVGGLFGGPDLLSYDTDGNFRWGLTVTAATSLSRTAQVAADPAGNIYFREPTIHPKLLKADGNGNLIWEKTFDGFSKPWDSLSISKTAEVYFTTSPGGTIYKLDHEGNTLWSTQAGASGDITVDELGNFYSIGQEITKWDPQGNTIWSKSLGSGFITTDYLGNLLLTRYAGSGQGSVSKFDPEGHLLWTALFGPIYWEFGADPLTTDRAGNIFVTGANTSATNVVTEALLVKLNPDGDLLWRHEFGTPADDLGYGVAADSQGNIYVTGMTFGDFGGTHQGSADGFLAKFTVPEPATLMLLVVGAVAMAKQRL